MALLRCDSFNHYVTIPLKWDFAFQGSIVTNAVARTGTRCLQIFNGSSGPAWNLGPQQLATFYDHLIQGVALNFDGLSGSSDVMYFSIVAPAVDAPNIGVTVNLDGSITVFRGAGDTGKVNLATSAAGLFTFSTPGNNVWNYLQVKWLGDLVNGSVEVRMSTEVNGVGTVPMSTILTISGVKTVAFASAVHSNQVQLLAVAGLTHLCFFNDYYCTDWSDGSDFLGGVRIYHDMPFANGSPVQFTPSAGSNFQNVDTVPPDTSRFNSAGTPGFIDQYQHNDNGIPPNSSILAVQHTMDALTDTSSHAITSVVNGTPHVNSVFLSNSFGMYTYQYDVNPSTGLTWKGADFPASFGPEVTA